MDTPLCANSNISRYRTDLRTDGENVSLVHFYRQLEKFSEPSHVAQLNLRFVS